MDETVTPSETTTQTPAPSPTADAAEKGDFTAFVKARESDPPEPGKGAEAATEPQTTATTEATQEAEDAAKASEAAKTLAERKGRAERRKTSIQGEIDDLVRQRSAEQAELARIRAERLALEAVAAKAAETKPAAATDDPEPQVADFDTYEKFVKAQARWEGRQAAREEAAAVEKKLDAKLAEERKRGETDAQTRAQQVVIAQHNARIEAARKAHADFDQVIAAAADVQLPTALMMGIPASPAGPELMYYFGKNPDVVEQIAELPITLPMHDAIMESPIAPKLFAHLVAHPEDAARISTLSPRQALVAMGKLESRLDVAQSGPTPAAAPVTRAMPPIKPVGASTTATSVSTTKLAEEGRVREFMDRRDREERERYRRRA